MATTIKPDDERRQVGLDRRVVLVGDGEDEAHQERRADHLVDERARPSEWK